MTNVSERELLVGSLRITLGLLGITTNAAQMVFTCRAKKPLTAFDKTVFSLSIADAISALFFALYGTARILFINNLVDLEIVWYVSIGLNFSVIASFNHIIFIALQRFCAVIYPLNVRVIINKNRLYSLLVITWLSAGLYGILSAVTRMDFLAVNSYLTLVAGIALIALYSGISYKMIYRDQLSQCSRSQAIRAKNRAVLMHSLLVTVGFIVCFFPFAITYLFMSYDFIAVVVSDLLVMSNTFLDVIIYFYIRICRNYKVTNEERYTLPATEISRREGVSIGSANEPQEVVIGLYQMEHLPVIQED